MRNRVERVCGPEVGIVVRFVAEHRTQALGNVTEGKCQRPADNLTEPPDETLTVRRGDEPRDIATS